MGGDGQSLTNKRTFLQKSKLYETNSDTTNDTQSEKSTQKQWRSERWTHCALTLRPLQFPAAFDLGGRIYSMQSVIDYLSDRRRNKESCETNAKNFCNIKKISDIKEIANEVKPNGQIRCPITDFLAQSGNHAFVGFWGCGHVLAASSLPVLHSDIKQEKCCPLCEVYSICVPLVLEPCASDKQQETLKMLLRAKKKRRRETEIK